MLYASGRGLTNGLDQMGFEPIQPVYLLGKLLARIVGLEPTLCLVRSEIDYPLPMGPHVTVRLLFGMSPNGYKLEPGLTRNSGLTPTAARGLGHCVCQRIYSLDLCYTSKEATYYLLHGQIAHNRQYVAFYPTWCTRRDSNPRGELSFNRFVVWCLIR